MVRAKNRSAGSRERPMADPKVAGGKVAAAKVGATQDDSADARIFPVDTRFQQMARRAGGIPRDRAIERAEAALEEARPGYDEWLERELEGLWELIKSAETGKAGPGWIDTAAFRCREIRDTAAPLGYELLAFIAGSLCELLDSFEADSECNMESIACHIDALMLARQGSYRHMKPEQVPELTKGLQRVVKHVTI